jgi:hypothetical protein
VRDYYVVAGAREGHLAELFGAAGLREIAPAVIAARVDHPSFDEWWEPFTLGVGPAGAYVAGLAPGDRDRLRERCRSRLPAPPFTVTAQAWAVSARA